MHFTCSSFCGLKTGLLTGIMKGVWTRETFSVPKKINRLKVRQISDSVIIKDVLVYRMLSPIQGSTIPQQSKTNLKRALEKSTENIGIARGSFLIPPSLISMKLV